MQGQATPVYGETSQVPLVGVAGWVEPQKSPLGGVEMSLSRMGDAQVQTCKKAQYVHLILVRFTAFKWRLSLHLPDCFRDFG